MTTQEKIKVFCYARHTGRNGAIVPMSQLDQWDSPEENPDWDIVAEGTEEEIVQHCRELLWAGYLGWTPAAEFDRRQLRAVLAMFHRPETPARMIDRNAWEIDGRIEFRGDEFEREEIEPEHSVETDNLTGWYPFSAVWRCGDTAEEYTYYVVGDSA